MRARSPKVLCRREQSWQSQDRRVPHTGTAGRGAAAQPESPAVRHVLSTTLNAWHSLYSAEHWCCLITEPQLKRRAAHTSSPAHSFLTLALCHIPPAQPACRGLIPVERQCSSLLNHTHNRPTTFFVVYFVFFPLSFLSLIYFLFYTVMPTFQLSFFLLLPLFFLPSLF